MNDCSAIVDDGSLFTFREHSAPVLTCDQHPFLDIAASGGWDTFLYVWSTRSGKVFDAIGHGYDVTAVRFSDDGIFMASGTLTGLILVHTIHPLRPHEKAMKIKRIDPKIELLFACSAGLGVSWLRWGSPDQRNGHGHHRLITSGGSIGNMIVCRMDRSGLLVSHPAGAISEIPNIGERCVGVVSSNGQRFFAGYSSGNIRLWDVEECTLLNEFTKSSPKFKPNVPHTEPITAVAMVGDSDETALYMSGDAKGNIVFSSANGPLAMVTTKGKVRCAAFGPASSCRSRRGHGRGRLAATGTLRGVIAVWDCERFELLRSCEHPESRDGIVRLEWCQINAGAGDDRSPFAVLLVGTMRGNIFGYDAETGCRIFTLDGHSDSVWDFKYNAERNVLVTVSHDCTGKVFEFPDNVMEAVMEAEAVLV